MTATGVGSRGPRKLAPIVAGLGVLLVLLVIIFRPSPPIERLVIVTATPGGTYFPLGNELASVLDRTADQPFDHADAVETAGSEENIERLLAGEADVAFAAKTALVGRSPDELRRITILAELYQDAVQVVARRETGIARLGDLSGRRVYTGRVGSGTEAIAAELLDLVGVPVTAGLRAGSEDDTYGAASERLIAGRLDAAFFVSGTPTEAVTNVIVSGCCRLLDLSELLPVIAQDETFAQKYDEGDILPGTYPGQPDQIRTLSTTVFLLAPRSLPVPVAVSVLDGLYDNLRDLLRAHARAEAIRYARPADDVVAVHPGAVRFWEGEDEKLRVATGALDGNYYTTGKELADFLKQHVGIDARVIHTGGSVENLDFLEGGRTLALMQFDVARAAFSGIDPRHIYGPGVDDSRLALDESSVHRGAWAVAVLGLEEVHAIIRRERLVGPATLSALNGLTVAVGPVGSGSGLVADWLLDLHAVPLDNRLRLPVGMGVDYLNAGLVDAMIFTAAVPSQALQAVLHDPAMRLLSVEPRRLGGLGPFELVWVEEETYGCQLPSDGPTRTIATRTVLVTSESPAFDVEAVTRAIIDNAMFLDDVEGGPETLATELDALPFHPDARAVYQARNLMPSPPPSLFGIALGLWVDWLKVAGQALLIVGMLVATYRGLLKIRRDSTTNEIGRRVFNVSVEASEIESVRKLTDLRREIRARVKRRWWQGGEINRDRWRQLEDLVTLGITEAREHLERALVTEIRKPPTEVLENYEARSRYYDDLRHRIWRHLENGELSADQHRQLIAVLDATERPYMGI